MNDGLLHQEQKLSQHFLQRGLVACHLLKAAHVVAENVAMELRGLGGKRHTYGTFQRLLQLSHHPQHTLSFDA